LRTGFLCRLLFNARRDYIYIVKYFLERCHVQDRSTLGGLAHEFGTIFGCNIFPWA